MKKLLFVILTGVCLFGACKKNDIPDLDFRQEMRTFIQEISDYAKNSHPGFIVIPQNGQELISLSDEATGQPATTYLNAIDGLGREDLLYGYNGDNIPTPVAERKYMEEYLDMAKSEGKTILVTDYCSVHSEMQYSYNQNALKGYISFAADKRELDHIPAFPNPIFHENDLHITLLSEAKNFLYLINPQSFASKDLFIDSLQKTNYDLLIIDLFYTMNVQLSEEDVESLKIKHNGGTRLVICYMSIGEAENYRYYWVPGWEFANPAWLDEANPDWPGNYKVRYWEPEWKSIILTGDDAYMKRILASGFDGVYLDLVDAFEYYEN